LWGGPWGENVRTRKKERLAFKKLVIEGQGKKGQAGGEDGDRKLRKKNVNLGKTIDEWQPAPSRTPKI